MKCLWLLVSCLVENKKKLKWNKSFLIFFTKKEKLKKGRRNIQPNNKYLNAIHSMRLG